MIENRYDDQEFFEQYSQMSRSKEGLSGAGEWHVLRELLPNMHNKVMLDLGCGYGWHCKYAIENGACAVVGIDVSEKMIRRAQAINSDPRIEYHVMAIEDYNSRESQFDVVLSSLTLHYIESFDSICKTVHRSLASGGEFIFSVEHPIFTAYGSQEWHIDADRNSIHWPVDNYFYEGERNATFLGQQVRKYHKTLTTYINGLLTNGFDITSLVEPQPSAQAINQIAGMKDEMRRPMMLIISARKR